ncbi:hypothetical protein HWV54_04595 [Bartonella alsatica]|uniref:Uncharacterized protein n=1 Tax=Bartonella alsatica TaxID=52764 RepID=A0ABX6QG93_9HYPH|nr:hypothetical protein [Bartonella alsatica]QLC52162.1 hypothetical protein HWV54_04595 [Bartonella alsatica]
MDQFIGYLWCSEDGFGEVIRLEEKKHVKEVNKIIDQSCFTSDVRSGDNQSSVKKVKFKGT